MAHPAPALDYVTEAEFLELPESKERIELIDGAVVVAPAPTRWHQVVLLRLTARLQQWAEAQPAAAVFQSPCDIRFGPDRILQPDAAVFSQAPALRGAGPIQQVPDLCVEVLSINRRHDRFVKRVIYAEAGVPEYWIIDPTGKVERLTGPGLGDIELVTDTLSSPRLPGFQVALETLFG